MRALLSIFILTIGCLSTLLAEMSDLQAGKIINDPELETIKAALDRYKHTETTPIENTEEVEKPNKDTETETQTSTTTTSVEELQEDCKNGNGKSCVSLGDFYAQNAKNKAKAIRLYLEGATNFKNQCQNKDAQACQEAGDLYAQGKKIKEDGNKAYEFYKKSCEYGDGARCRKIGEMYFNGNEIDEDTNKAIEFLEKACEKGDGDGCWKLGDIYFEGKGINKDKNKAEEFYQKAADPYAIDCNNKDKKGCQKLGDIYGQGKGVSKDKDKAEEFYQKACQYGDEASCLKFETSRNWKDLLQNLWKWIQNNPLLIILGLITVSIIGFVIYARNAIKQFLKSLIQRLWRAVLYLFYCFIALICVWGLSWSIWKILTLIF